MSEKSLAPVPYEDGNDCIFYAVQDANMFFNAKPLTYKDKAKYQTERTKRVRLLKSLTGLNEKLGIWLPISVQMILKKMDENGIEPDTYLCCQETKKLLETSNFVKRSGAKFQTSEGDAEVELPALVFMERESMGDEHVWFCGDVEQYDRDHSKHYDDQDRLILFISLKKKATN